jgi:hypothetical protein
MSEFDKFTKEADDAFWFLRDDGKKHESIFAYVQDIEESPRHRDIRRRNVAHAQLYSNRYEVGFDSEYSPNHFRDGYSAVTDNLIQSMVDTATSLQGTSKVKPTFLTDGADWETYKTSEDLTKVNWGLWNSLELNAKRTTMFRDAAIFGTGCLRASRHKGRIHVDRVIIDDIVVDEDALPASGGKPRQLHQVRFVAKEVLHARFDDDEATTKAIDEASCGWRRRTDWRGTKGSDLVLVVESWHLPSGPDATDGRYCMSIDTATLVDESYDSECYPHIFFHYDEPVTGFYGRGVAELLLGHQIRLNQLHDFKRRAQDLMSAPRWWVNSASRVLDNVFVNDMGVVGHYSGPNAPVSVTPQAVHPEIYQEEMRIEESALRRAGISSMSANATRPEGVEHAVALRELSDSQAKRHVERSARLEATVKPTVQLLIHFLKDIVLDKSDLSDFPETELLERIKWKKVDLYSTRFTVQVETASVMSETPAGRKQGVIELLQYGGFEMLGAGNPQVGMQEAMRLIGHPDLGQSQMRANVDIKHIEWVIGRLREGEMVLPEQFDNFEFTIPRVIQAMKDFEVRNCPEEILDLFRNYVEQAEEMLRARQAPPPMAAPVDPAMMGQDPAMDPTLAMDPAAMDPSLMGM